MRLQSSRSHPASSILTFSPPGQMCLVLRDEKPFCATWRTFCLGCSPGGQALTCEQAIELAFHDHTDQFLSTVYSTMTGEENGVIRAY